MKYVRLENNVVKEILETDEDISELFHPSIVWKAVQGQNPKVGQVLSAGSFVDAPVVIDYSVVERIWRDGELVRADEELNKVQDSDPKAVGTVTQWREYRRALRGIPELEGFPSSHVRPVAPDSV